MTSRSDQGGPLRSEFADDAEMRELIEFYLDELSRKVSAIEACLACDDSKGIERMAHRLKGSSAGYGFSPIGEAAGELEAAIRQDTDASVVELTGQLLELCARALMTEPD